MSRFVSGTAGPKKPVMTLVYMQVYTNIIRVNIAYILNVAYIDTRKRHTNFFRPGEMMGKLRHKTHQVNLSVLHTDFVRFSLCKKFNFVRIFPPGKLLCKIYT